MLLDDQMLQPPQVGILRRELDGFSKRHHPIHCLLDFVKRFP